MKFATDEEFEIWKAEYQDNNLVNFVVHKTYQSKDKLKRTYVCNRYGTYRQKGPHQYRPDVQGCTYAKGSPKIGDICTCSIMYEGCADGKEICLFPDHNNHALDNSHKQHLKMPKTSREEIIKKMKSGVTIGQIFKEIADEFQSVVSDEDAKEIHFQQFYHF